MQRPEEWDLPRGGFSGMTGDGGSAGIGGGPSGGIKPEDGDGDDRKRKTTKPLEGDVR